MMDSEGMNPDYDPGSLTFSQAQGYANLPGPLKLEELPNEARTRIWNVFYPHIEGAGTFEPGGDFPPDNKLVWVVGPPWGTILYKKHLAFDHLAIDDWNYSPEHQQQQLRQSIETLPFNVVFDLVQFVLRHKECPADFIKEMKDAFVSSRLAYAIDDGPPPTIIPSVTVEEGKAILESLETLRKAGLGGSATHLRKAAECINGQDWAGSVRESIHSVESVARRLDSKASNELGPALKSLERSGILHPALKEAFTKLYGYTSNEQGIRHALLDQDSANVGLDEAVFMLGACASFSSYLWRKHAAESE